MDSVWQRYGDDIKVAAFGLDRCETVLRGVARAPRLQ
ncbi:MAG: hypothetical protein ACI9U2_001813 [Bradymonadia bacterium]|jgi:hypothetical protein